MEVAGIVDNVQLVSPPPIPPTPELKARAKTKFSSYWPSPECSEHAVAEAVIWLPVFLGEHSIIINHLDLAYLYIHSLTVVKQHALIAGCFSSSISPFQLSFPFFNQQIFMEHLLYEWHSVRKCLCNDNTYFIEFIVHTNCMPIFLFL